MSHETSILVADSLRIVTVIELGIVMGLTLVVFTLYFVGNIHIARADPSHHGALLHHVIGVSASYILLAVFAIVEIQGYYGSPLTFRAPIGFVAATLGIYALVNMLSFQNTRLDLRDKRVHVGGTPRE